MLYRQAIGYASPNADRQLTALDTIRYTWSIVRAWHLKRWRHDT